MRKQTLKKILVIATSFVTFFQLSYLWVPQPAKAEEIKAESVATSKQITLPIPNQAKPNQTQNFLPQNSVWSGSIIINNNDIYTNFLNVTLTLLGSHAGDLPDDMRFSNDDFNWSYWEPYDVTKSWTLASGPDGIRTVWVQYRYFTDPGWSYSPHYSDEIILDTTAPTTNFSINPSNPNGKNNWYYQTPPRITLASNEAGTTWYKWNCEGDASNSIQYTQPFEAIEGENYLCYYSQDLAGNVENINYSPIKVDTAGPLIQINLNPPDPDGRNSWYKSIPEITLASSDETSGPDQIWYKWDDQADWQLYDTAFYALEGEHILYTKATDFAGNESFLDREVKVDTQAPVAPGNLNINLQDDSVILTWSGVSDAVLYRVYRAGSPYQLIAEVAAPNTTFVDRPSQKGITYYYKVTAVDKAGNETSLDLVSAISVILPVPMIYQIVSPQIQPVAITGPAFIPAVQAAPTEERAISTPEAPKPGEVSGETEELPGKNWPQIIAIIIATIIIILGIIYYWVASKYLPEEEPKISKLKPKGRGR